MIGDRIKLLRIQKQITQETLAKSLFISPQAVSRWELGLAVPDTAILVPLADFFGVSVDFLLREPSNNPCSDYSSSFEVRKEMKSPYMILHFKNISSHTFEKVSYKVKFLNKAGEVIDYRSDWFCDSEPGTTKVMRELFALNPVIKDATIAITITDCKLL